MSQSVRHLLETRFNGDLGATEALAEDLGLTIEEVYVLAQAAGIQAERLSDSEKSEGAAQAGGTKRGVVRGGRRETRSGAPDGPIPLQAQLHLAMHYHDAEASLEQLARDLSRMLEDSGAAISVEQVDAWARRLGLRTRRKSGRARVSPQVDEPPIRKPTRPVEMEALQLDAGEWARFLSPDAARRFLPDESTQTLSTVEEIRLGYQVSLGALERSKAPKDRGPDIIEVAMQAEARLAAAILPLVWREALIRLGRGLPLEALLAVGRCGLDEAIFRFDYADSYPLLSRALPAITYEMEQLIAGTSPVHLEVRQTRRLHLYARLASVSCRLARAMGRAPTVNEVASALSLAPDRAERVIRFVLEAEWKDEAGEDEARRGRERVSDIQFIDAFMKTQGLTSGDVVKELAAILPLTALTVQVKFYSLRLHTRLAERDQRRELAALCLEARRAIAPLHMLAGHFLWDVIVDGHAQRWALDVPYGRLADTIAPGSRVFFRGRLYEASRVYYSTLVVHSVEDAAASQGPDIPVI